MAGTWASKIRDRNQFLELEFEVAVKPTEINIYETYNSGGVVCIKAKGSSNQWQVLWSTATATNIKSSRIFSPPIACAGLLFPVRHIRLEVDCTVAGSWCEIDAVELVGRKPVEVCPADDTIFLEEIGALVNNRLHSDVELRINDDTVYGHKAILATRSTFFANMFKNDTNAKLTLRLPGTSKNDLVSAFTFLYTNRLPQQCSMDTLINICKASDCFEVPDMKKAALHMLSETISCNNVISLFTLAVENTAVDEIKAMCVSFMAENVTTVSQLPAFETMPRKCLVQLVQMAAADMTLSSKVFG